MSQVPSSVMDEDGIHRPCVMTLSKALSRIYSISEIALGRSLGMVTV